MHFLCQKFGWYGKNPLDNFEANHVFDFIMDDCKMYSCDGLSLDTMDLRIEWYA